MWDNYSNDIRNSHIHRVVVNPLRYGVFWGRKKDSNRYLSKIISLFKDQELLSKAQESFITLLDDFFPLYYEIASDALETSYRELTGRNAR